MQISKIALESVNASTCDKPFDAFVQYALACMNPKTRPSWYLSSSWNWLFYIKWCGRHHHHHHHQILLWRPSTVAQERLTTQTTIKWSI